MGLSVIPFIIAQFPKMLKTHHGQRLAVLLALIASFLLVFSYCLYQVSESFIRSCTSALWNDNKIEIWTTRIIFVSTESSILHQVFQPWIQRRKLAYAKHKHVISGILRHAQMQALGRLLNDDGTPNEDVIRKYNALNIVDTAGECCFMEMSSCLVYADCSARLT